jgi:hypothetical protein
MSPFVDPGAALPNKSYTKLEHQAKRACKGPSRQWVIGTLGLLTKTIWDRIAKANSSYSLGFEQRTDLRKTLRRPGVASWSSEFSSCSRPEIASL